MCLTRGESCLNIHLFHRCYRSKVRIIKQYPRYWTGTEFVHSCSRRGHLGGVAGNVIVEEGHWTMSVVLI